MNWRKVTDIGQLPRRRYGAQAQKAIVGMMFANLRKKEGKQTRVVARWRKPFAMTNRSRQRQDQSRMGDKFLHPGYFSYCWPFRRGPGSAAIDFVPECLFVSPMKAWKHRRVRLQNGTQFWDWMPRLETLPIMHQLGLVDNWPLMLIFSFSSNSVKSSLSDDFAENVEFSK